MKLYDLIKDRLKDPQGVISDNEMVVLNRRDFLYSETSASAAILRLFNADRVTYEMYSIIDFLHSFVCRIRSPSEVRIYQLSQSMTLPSLAVSAFVGDLSASVRVHAPRGIQTVQARDGFAKTLADRFLVQISNGLSLEDLGSDEIGIDIIFCNASNEAEVASGLKLFEKVRRGLVLVKGYGRARAPNCGEIILEARLNIHCSLAGYGFCAAI